MPAEYVEPTPRGRTRILIEIAVVAVMVSAAVVASSAIKSLPVCEVLPWTALLFSAAALFCLAVAALLIRTLWCMLSARQYPLPGASVLFRTRVRRGPRLMLDAAALVLGAAGLIWLVAVLPANWGLFDGLLLAFKECA